MASKKKPTAKAKPARASAKPKPKPPTPVARVAQAARPAFGPDVADDALGEPLADVSGTFAVREHILGAQRDSDEDALRRFPDQSLVIRAQGLDDPLDD
jgi:hypothetical protein